MVETCEGLFRDRGAEVVRPPNPAQGVDIGYGDKHFPIVQGDDLILAYMNPFAAAGETESLVAL